MSGDLESIEKVETEINKQGKIADRNWLIEKIGELKK